MSLTNGINLEFQNNKKYVRIEGLLHIDINHKVRKMVELLEEARATGKDAVYDAPTVCNMFNLPECFEDYLKDLPVEKHCWYGQNKIIRVSENLYIVE